MVMVFLLPILLAATSLVDSKPLASILPLLRHIDSMNPQGPHFTIEAIKQHGGLLNSVSYQLWPQDSPSSPSSPSSSSSSYLVSPQTALDSATAPAINFAP